MIEKLKYSTLIDYVLATLKQVREERPNKYLSLIRLLEIFQYQSSISDIQELGRYLEAKGWAKLLILIGDVRVQITTRGVLYVEEKDNGFFEEFAKFRQQIREETPDDDRILKLFNEDEDPKYRILELLRKVIEDIRRKGDSPDLVKDAEIISLEIQKTTPDLKIVGSKLDTLTSLSYLSSQVQELKDFLIPF